jgi:hypothetical protein
MKIYWFCKKRILSHFRDKRSMFILWNAIIAQIMLFGFAIKRNQQRKIAVLDQSKDTET